MDDCIVLDVASGFFPKQLNLLAKYRQVPLHGTFELTPRCNFNCKMCYVHLKDSAVSSFGQELSTDKWLSLAEEARNLGLLYLSLTGGEIFVRKDFRYIYEELSKMGFLIQLMTNASCINDSNIEWLSKSPPYSVRVTLYGANNETYYNVCGVHNGFSRVDYALKLLKQAKIPVRLTSTLIKDNQNDLPAMYEYARANQLPFQHTYAVHQSRRGVETDAYHSRINLTDFPIEFLKTHYKDQKTASHGPYPHHKNYLYDCGQFGSSYVITWNGNLRLCPSMIYPNISLCNTSLADGWDEMMALLNKIQKPSECTTCKYEEYCLRCPGVLTAEAGSYDKISEDYCSRAKYLYEVFNT